VTLARSFGQILERIDEFALNLVGDGQTCFRQKVTPDLLKIAFGFRRDDVRFHDSE
jgi:hypothetical protein